MIEDCKCTYFDEPHTPEETSPMGFLIIVVIYLVIIGAGVLYCKKSQMYCFAPKTEKKEGEKPEIKTFTGEEGEDTKNTAINEGGERELYRATFKNGKKSH